MNDDQKPANHQRPVAPKRKNASIVSCPYYRTNFFSRQESLYGIEALLLLNGPSAGVGEDNIMQEHSVIALLFGFDLDPFPHLSFATCRISDFPQLA